MTLAEAQTHGHQRISEGGAYLGVGAPGVGHDAEVAAHQPTEEGQQPRLGPAGAGMCSVGQCKMF